MRFCLRIRKESKGFIDFMSSDSLKIIQEIGRDLIHTFEKYKSASIFEAGILVFEINKDLIDWDQVKPLSDIFYIEN